MWKPDTGRIAEAVHSAPSIFGSQPWSLDTPADDRIELRASLGEGDGEGRGHWDRWLGADGTFHPDPLAREFAIGCGAALFNLRLAIRVAGHDLAVWLLPDPGRDSALLASVEIVTGRIKVPTTAEQELYEAIWRIQTDPSPYTIIAPPLPLIVTMEDAAAAEGGSLRLLHDREARRWRQLAAEADRDLAADPRGLSPSARERYRRYREQRDRWTKREGEGEDVAVAAAGDRPPSGEDHPPARGSLRRGDRGGQGKRHSEHKPRLMALSTDDDQPLDWLRAGQALQRAILTGTRYSVSAPYGLAAEYHAPRRYGVPARRHLLPGHDELANYGLSVSFLSQPLERYDIEGEDAGGEPRHWPWRWRFPELPQMVIQVGYAPVHVAAARLGSGVPQA